MLVEIFLFFFMIVANDGKHHAERREWLWKFGEFLTRINSRERIIIKRCTNGRTCIFRAVKMSEPVGEGG